MYIFDNCKNFTCPLPEKQDNLAIQVYWKKSRVIENRLLTLIVNIHPRIALIIYTHIHVQVGFIILLIKTLQYSITSDWFIPKNRITSLNSSILHNQYV